MSGDLFLIFGPMFSGKTSYLKSKMNVSSHIEGRDKTLIISSSLDDRPELSQIGILSTHSLIDDMVHSKSKNNEVKTLKLADIDHLTSDIKVIGIDESQFYDDLVEYVTKWRSEGKTIYSSGLLATSEGKMFGHMYELIPFASEIIHLKAVCMTCVANGTHRKPAIMSKYTEKKTVDVVVGGAGSYVAVCYDHWIS